ncbi:hypothetical protein ACFYOG_37260 [Streptomyces sp. NPDC007818]|uniref:hypothetical protein n=1 Tax=Streptomyces sp. NPDC007818 TaxID=3364780 RepID=UPI0036C9B028
MHDLQRSTHNGWLRDRVDAHDGIADDGHQLVAGTPGCPRPRCDRCRPPKPPVPGGTVPSEQRRTTAAIGDLTEDMALRPAVCVGTGENVPV